MNSKLRRKLIETAKRARERAYCPYSRFPVGAAILTEENRLFFGSNVENASYGLTICAERVAIANAVTRGAKGIKAICVVGRAPKPCGACRQVMAEFSAKDTQVLLVDVGADSRKETVLTLKMRQLLPHAFDPLEAGLLPPNPQNLLKRGRAKKARKRTPRKKR
jgi:cytidine deaminase